MAELWQHYTREVHKGLHYLASWPPSARVGVGDIAVMIDGSLERQATLQDAGLPYAVARGADVRHRGWASAGSVSLGGGAAADAPLSAGTQAGAEIEASFRSTHAILLRAERSREDSLERLDQIKQGMLAMRAAGTWQQEWLMITHVVHAQSLMVLISKERNASARLLVSGSVGADAHALATGSAGVQVLSASGMAYEEHGIADATPLYLAVRVQERFGRTARVKRIGRRGNVRTAGGSYEVVDVTP
jgi:hypothetical protein